MTPIIDKRGDRWIAFDNSEKDMENANKFYRRELTFGNTLEELNERIDDDIIFEEIVGVEESSEYPYDSDELEEESFKMIAIKESNERRKDGTFEICWNLATKQNEKPLENVSSCDYNKGIGEKQMANTNKGIDVGSLMNMKMVEKLLDKEDFEIKDLMAYQMKTSVMQGIIDGQGININDIIRQKLMTKYMLDDKAEDMNFTQLAILNMLQNGRIDINQLVMVKMLEKLDK